ncbi:hypothetical protein Tdes44962_MAKER07042 [Teratosphaeria destructans]|uniref:Uncharacterized protein n=1 Tax=Teratosphaeria destructans TaxID=418781 RepID=A0A9W7T0R9_9PEZI|nr:hypothetical protein Tdes44962_MAKER07042 [Teratosphaeria destructans]
MHRHSMIPGRPHPGAVVVRVTVTGTEVVYVDTTVEVAVNVACAAEEEVEEEVLDVDDETPYVPLMVPV